MLAPLAAARSGAIAFPKGHRVPACCPTTLPWTETSLLGQSFPRRLQIAGTKFVIDSFTPSFPHLGQRGGRWREQRELQSPPGLAQVMLTDQAQQPPGH